MTNSNIIKNSNKEKFNTLSNEQAIDVLGRVANWTLSEISKLLLLANDEEKSVLEELKIEQTEAYKLSRDKELSQQEREMWYARAIKASNTILAIAKNNKVKVAVISTIGVASVVTTIVLAIINQGK